MAIPELTTERLLLRPFSPDDSVTVQELVGVREVAATVDGIDHPYPVSAGLTWIGSHAADAEEGRSYTWAITNRHETMLLGAVSLRVDVAHRRGGIGYWIGQPWWNQGYATEATGGVVAYAFDVLQLHRLQAFCLPTNTGSVRVLEKLGFTREGTLRDYVLKWGEFQDRGIFGLLRD
jgi:ribosomal-protein-alanine N-acetyltransferase